MDCDRPTRPRGVVERFRALVADDRNYASSHPELRLRIALTEFLTLSARQRYSDLPIGATLDRFYAAHFALREEGQRRTGSDFEKRSIDCVRQLHPMVDGYAERHPDAEPLDVDEGVRRLFVEVPPQVMLGEGGPDSSFDLICWNAANSLAEGVKRPYFAARPVAHAAYHRPADRYGLAPPLIRLTERYEDDPELRVETAAEITIVLMRFLDAAPWPR